jgi:D-sedoheptulose 7-phosphate isomerase
MPDHQDFIRAYAAESARVIASLAEQADQIARIGQAITTSLIAGGKLLAAGNGGSAAEAMHLCEELTGKYRDRRRALPALCLNADGSALTCIANDWDFQRVFSRQLEAFCKPGDVFVGFTTSGQSANILRALATARSLGGITIGLLGRGGGQARQLCDLPLVVASDKSNHIQEAHQAVLHLILEYVDAQLPPTDK